MAEPKPKVVTLPGIERAAPPGPDAQVVAHCRQLLEKAESGELRALAYAALNRREEGGVATAWVRGEGASLFTLLGAVALLSKRVLDGTE